jgi:hypothetical protein
LDPRWPDAALGANPEAAAALLIHVAPTTTRNGCHHFMFHLQRGLEHAVDTNMVEAVAGIMGPVEVLCVAAPGHPASTVAQKGAFAILLCAISKEWAVWEGAAAPDEALVERLLALAGALARLLALCPAGIFLLNSAATHKGLVGKQLLQAADFLGRTSTEHRSVERTPAWAWNAVDPARASAVDAEKALAAAGADAKSFLVRRALLRCLAAPVTHLSAREESDILMLTRPSVALRAHVALLRMRRACAVLDFSGPLEKAVGPQRDPSTYRVSPVMAQGIGSLFDEA